MKTSSKLSLPQLKKQLKSYKTDELVNMLVDCYKLSDDVKNYIHVLIEPEGTVDSLYTAARAKVEQEFYPHRGAPKLRYAQAKKAISDFNKFSNDTHKTIDLMIYYVELGVRFTNDYGDIDEPFYNSMVSMYWNVLKKIQALDGPESFGLYKQRLYAIVKDTRGVGWGFHDHLAGLYFEFASDYEAEDEEDET